MLLETIAMLCISASNNNAPISEARAVHPIHENGKTVVYIPGSDTPRDCQIRLLKCVKKKQAQEARKQEREIQKAEKQIENWDKENCKEDFNQSNGIRGLNCKGKRNPFVIMPDYTPSEFKLEQKSEEQEKLENCLLEQE